MKKQVTFAERQDGAFQRAAGTKEAKTAFRGGFNRPPPARCDLQHVATVQIPRSMSAAPFLKHAALTPAQKEFLYTIAASYSGARVRTLITQHYMNVLHRRVRTGSEEDQRVGTSVASHDESGKHQKINTSAKNPGKSCLPKIPNRPARSSNSSPPKQRKMKNLPPTSPALRRKSPGRSRMKPTEEEEEEEGLDDSLSECLSSLSVGEWDDDTFSDL